MLKLFSIIILLLCLPVYSDQLNIEKNKLFNKLDINSDHFLDFIELKPYSEEFIYILDKNKDKKLNELEFNFLLYPSSTILYNKTKELFIGKIFKQLKENKLNNKDIDLLSKYCFLSPIYYFIKAKLEKNIIKKNIFLKKCSEKVFKKYKFLFITYYIIANKYIKEKDYNRALIFLLKAQVFQRTYTHYIDGIDENAKKIQNIFLNLSKGKTNALNDFPKAKELKNVKKLLKAFDLQINKNYKTSIEMLSKLKDKQFIDKFNNEISNINIICNLNLKNYRKFIKGFEQMTLKFPEINSFYIKTNKCDPKIVLNISLKDKTIDNMFNTEISTLFMAYNTNNIELSNRLLDNILNKYFIPKLYYYSLLYNYFNKNNELFYENLFNLLKNIIFPLYIKVKYKLYDIQNVITIEQIWNNIKNKDIQNIFKTSYYFYNKNYKMIENIFKNIEFNKKYAKSYKRIIRYLLQDSKLKEDIIEIKDIIELYDFIYE